MGSQLRSRLIFQSIMLEGFRMERTIGQHLQSESGRNEPTNRVNNPKIYIYLKDFSSPPIGLLFPLFWKPQFPVAMVSGTEREKSSLERVSCFCFCRRRRRLLFRIRAIFNIIFFCISCVIFKTHSAGPSRPWPWRALVP